MMRKQTGWLRVIPLACVSVVLGVTGSARATMTYGGRAFAAYVNTALTGSVYISDTGELPGAGGFRYNSLLGTDLLNVISAQILNASMIGQRGQSIGCASLSNVVVLPNSPYRLTASFVRAGALADCYGTIRNGEVLALNFCNHAVNVTGQPNQILKVPGATLIINEQTITSGTGYHEARSNAIHLKVDGVAEVILSGVRASMYCPDAGPPPAGVLDAMTGCGEINSNGCPLDFSFDAGYPANSWTPTGCFQMCDHSNNLEMHTITVTNFWGTGPTRTFKGACAINGCSGFEYWVAATDNGYPGAGLDYIKISLSNGYYREGLLSCGDIKLCSRN